MAKLVMLLMRKGLGKNIGNHFICWIPKDNSFTSCNESIPHIVIFTLNVLGTSSELWIFCEDNSSTVVATEFSGTILWMSNILEERPQPC